MNEETPVSELTEEANLPLAHALMAAATRSMQKGLPFAVRLLAKALHLSRERSAQNVSLKLS